MINYKEIAPEVNLNPNRQSKTLEIGQFLLYKIIRVLNIHSYIVHKFKRLNFSWNIDKRD